MDNAGASFVIVAMIINESIFAPLKCTALTLPVIALVLLPLQYRRDSRARQPACAGRELDGNGRTMGEEALLSFGWMK
ncbi:MAG: hypothetical protein Q7T82_20575 [Armatimonadota bacterium]|nr:hypothetical protein [Armatimonadota bacterium]